MRKQVIVIGAALLLCLRGPRPPGQWVKVSLFGCRKKKYIQVYLLDKNLFALDLV